MLDVPGLGPVPVSEGEFLALTDLMTRFHRIPLNVPAVFLMSGPGAGRQRSVAQAYSNHTGRLGYVYTAPHEVAEADDPSGPLRIMAHRTDNTGKRGKWAQTIMDVPSDSDEQPGAPSSGQASSGQTSSAPSGTPTVEDPGAPDPLLSPETLMRDASGAVRGRNLTSEKIERLLTGRIRVYESRPGLPLKRVSKGVQESAPWPDDAYVVAAESDGGGGVRAFDGQVLDAHQLAEKLAADPELAKLPQNVPVVLAIPYAGAQYQEFLKVVAARLGRTVWGPSGEGRPQRNGTRREHVLALIDRDPDLLYGDWIPMAPPASMQPSVDREWTAVDGTRFRDSDVDTRPMVTNVHRWFGRMSLNDNLRYRYANVRTYFEKRLLERYTVTGDGIRDFSTEDLAPVDRAVYVFMAHGTPGGLALVLRGGRRVVLSAADGGRYIGGLPELGELPPGHRLGLESCWSASGGDPTQNQLDSMPPPHVDDPLADVELGQHAANNSGRDTDASLMIRGIGTDAFILTTAANGLQGRIVRYRPEPRDHELDQLARDTKLHAHLIESPQDTREAMLRLVRALRRAFGKEIENDRGVPGGRYERVLEGIVALENLRANDPALGRFTPFRMDLWAFYAQASGGNTPDQAAYLAVLDTARIRLAAHRPANSAKICGTPPWTPPSPGSPARARPWCGT